MKWSLSLILVLLAVGTLRVLGCGGGGGGTGGVSGDGGDGGASGSGGRTVCFDPCAGGGFGGGCYGPKTSGIWSGRDSGSPIAGGPEASTVVRFEVGEDCISLVPTTECPIDAGRTEATIFEVQLDGLDAQLEECNAGIGVTAEMAAESEFRNTYFTIEVTDDTGGDWLIEGEFLGAWAVGTVKRTDENGYCEGIWSAFPGCEL